MTICLHCHAECGCSAVDLCLCESLCPDCRPPENEVRGRMALSWFRLASNRWLRGMRGFG